MPDKNSAGENESRDSKSQSATRKRKRRIIFFLLIVAIIYIIIFLIKWPYKVVAYPAVGTAAYIEQVEQYENKCISRPHNFTDPWNKELYWRRDESTLSPTLILSNLEPSSGTFLVQFAFYSEEKYPWDPVNGGNANATWENADYYSEQRAFLIGARQSRSIEIPTDVGNTSKKFWVNDKIIPPNITQCQPFLTYKNVTRTRAVRGEAVQETIKLTIWEMIFYEKNSDQSEEIAMVNV